MEHSKSSLHQKHPTVLEKEAITMNPADRFYFYNSAIGDLTALMRKYSVSGQNPTPGYVTNAFGVKINPKFFPSLLADREGVEPIPIPANWHADIAEFGAALRAVDLSGEKFTAIELGCGWGCWLNITGLAAKRKGCQVKLIGIEGDAGHADFAVEALTDNGFHHSEFSIHRGIASAHNGVALFPRQERAGESWGLEPIFNATASQVKKLIESGSYEELPQISLSSVVPDDCDRVDLLHIDIQGGEIPLVPDSMGFLNNKVSMMLIGTHSRPIEGMLFDLLSDHGWVLEVERPAILQVGKSIATKVDGVQLWRNPRLIPDRKVFEVQSNGSVTALEHPAQVERNSKFNIKVRVKNESQHNWPSTGDYPVRLAYHWMQNGGYVEFEGIRTEFEGKALNFATESDQEILVQAPDHAGHLQLEVTIVQDGIRWFSPPDFKVDSVDIDVI